MTNVAGQARQTADMMSEQLQQQQQQIAVASSSSSTSSSSTCTCTSSIGQVQERFPNDDLHLDDKTVNPDAASNRRKLLPLITKKQTSSHTSLRSPSPVDSDRTLILEGRVQLSTSLQTQYRYLFLFTDLLIIGKERSMQNLRLKNRVRVSEMWIAMCVDEVSEIVRAPECSFVIGWPTTNVVATFESIEVKDLWLAKFKELIGIVKAKEVPASVILKIVNRDPNYSVTKCLSVGNTEEARTVVRRCLAELHLEAANVGDYQLWVTSSADEPLYPLIGHEHPYSIRMNYLRRVRGSPRLNGADIVMSSYDANANDDHCQFVLRCNKIQQKITFDEVCKLQPKKGRRLNVMKLFGRRAVKSPRLGLLFGRDLDTLCANGQLCQPVMSMLRRLFTVGTFTDGIFRRSANHRKCRDVKERLDLGHAIDFNDVSVLVVAALLKDLLRSLPNCLLACELYQQWIEAVVLTDVSKQVAEMKRLVVMLPASHSIMLRHLVCVLYHISMNATSNNMNPRNLAVCVAQNLLWPPRRTGATEMLGDVDRVSLVCQRLVENVVSIFGVGCLSLFGELTLPVGAELASSNSCLNSTTGVARSTDSESLHSLASDTFGVVDESPFNSLERESCCSEMESSSPQLVCKPDYERHFSNTSTSRDSGLTMSNPQLYDDSAAISTSPVDETVTLQSAMNSVNTAADKTTEGRTEQIRTTVKSKDGAVASSSSLFVPRPTVVISDDSMLGSPDERSADSSEMDWDDMFGVRQRSSHSADRTTPRLRSLESDSCTGLASTYYALRPNSFDVTVDNLSADLVESKVSPVRNEAARSEHVGAHGRDEPAAGSDASARPTVLRHQLHRTNAIDRTSPGSIERHKRGMTDRGSDLFPGQIRRSLLGPVVSGDVPLDLEILRPAATTTTTTTTTTLVDRALLLRTSSLTSTTSSSSRRNVDSIDRSLPAVAPPSYEEALLHKQLLRPDLGDDELQRNKHRLARLLYEKSLKMYTASQPQPDLTCTLPVSNRIPVAEQSPVGRTTKLHIEEPIAESLKQSEPSHRRRLPPTYESVSSRSLSVDHSHSSNASLPDALHTATEPVHVSNSAAVTASRTAVVPLQTQSPCPALRPSPTADSSSSDKSPTPPCSREGSTRRRVLRKRASDRRRQRYSDPKLSGKKSGPAANAASKLGRSKSDSSDLVSRLCLQKVEKRVSTAQQNDCSSSTSSTTSSSPSVVLRNKPTNGRRPASTVISASATRFGTDCSSRNDAKPERRKSCTIKDRDWHRELAEQYKAGVLPDSSDISRIRAAVAAGRSLAKSRDVTTSRRAAAVSGPTANENHFPAEVSRSTEKVIKQNEQMGDALRLKSEPRKAAFRNTDHLTVRPTTAHGGQLGLRLLPDLPKLPYATGNTAASSFIPSGNAPITRTAATLVVRTNRRSGSIPSRNKAKLDDHETISVPSAKSLDRVEPLPDRDVSHTVDGINWNVTRLREIYSTGIPPGNPGLVCQNTLGNSVHSERLAPLGHSGQSERRLDRTNSASAVCRRGAVQRLL